METKVTISPSFDVARKFTFEQINERDGMYRTYEVFQGSKLGHCLFLKLRGFPLMFICPNDEYHAPEVPSQRTFGNRTFVEVHETINIKVSH